MVIICFLCSIPSMTCNCVHQLHIIIFLFFIIPKIIWGTRYKFERFYLNISFSPEQGASDMYNPDGELNSKVEVVDFCDILGQ